MSAKTKTEHIASLQGKLLVATPFIQEAPYHRAVVLMMQHNEQGACGLVLHNDLESNLAAVEESLQLAETGNKRFETEPSPASKLFSGCIVWPAGQLEREVDMGVWMPTMARLNASFVTNDLWYSLLSRIGRSVLEESLQIVGFPPDANLN